MTQPEAAHKLAERLESEAAVIETVERLAEKFRPGAIDRDRERRLPHEEIAELKRAGVFAITVPRQYGGLGASARTVGEVFRILSKADPSIGQIPQNHFCFLPTFSFGTPEQAEFFYGRILAGDSIGNAHSENSRKRAGTYEHDLRKVDGGWTFTGKKFYSTGAAFAEWIPFIGYDDQNRQLMFFVDAQAPGVKLVNDWSGMGQRTTASGTTLFENVFVPDFHVFPYYLAGEATRPTRLLAALIHSAIDLGIAEEAQDDLLCVQTPQGLCTCLMYVRARNIKMAICPFRCGPKAGNWCKPLTNGLPPITRVSCCSMTRMACVLPSPLPG